MALPKSGGTADHSIQLFRCTDKACERGSVQL